LQAKPEIPSLAKYASKHMKRVVNHTTVIEEAGGESATKPNKRSYRSPDVTGAQDKWDWLYKVGVKKVVDQKKAGRLQDDIVYEREKEEYTFHPNRGVTSNKKKEEE
jgi:hypothetical protein